MFQKIMVFIGITIFLVLMLAACVSNNPQTSQPPASGTPPSPTPTITPLPSPTGNTPTSSGEIKAALGQEFTLSVGQTVAINGEDLKIKFDSVTNDSRCPRGVQCIWAGEAKVQLEITHNYSTSQVVYTISGGSEAIGQDFFNQYKASFKLEPYPEANQQIAAADYKLTMTITK